VRVSQEPVYTPLDRELRMSTRIAFGVGQVAEGLKTFSFSFFALFYYNNVLGLPGSLCGVALAIALVFDAFSDPLMGSISDNFRSRYGRRHPFMAGASVPLALAFIALFSPPASLDETGLFFWLTATAILTRSLMTIYHVPHISMGAELSSHFLERTRLVIVRQIFGYVGIFVIAGVGLGWFFTDERGGRLNADAYAPFSVVIGAVMVVTILLSVWFTRDQIPFLPTHRAEAGASRNVFRRMFAECREAFANRSFRFLFAGVLLIYILVGTESALALYMYEFFWALSDDHMFLLLAFYPAGLVVGALLTTRIHERWNKRDALIFGTAGWAFFQILPVVLRLLDLFPANGTKELIVSLVAFRILQGAVVQQALASFSSMMGDIADEHELETGRRQEGIFFGVVAFSGKAASGAGSLIAGIALDLIAWPAGGTAAVAGSIPPETIRNLGIVYGPLVAVFAVLGPLSYRGYSLDRARHREILAALARRNEDSATANDHGAT